MCKRLIISFLCFLGSTALACDNCLPIQIYNSTELSEEVYFFIKAETSGQDCAMKIDLNTGIGQCEIVSTKTDLSTYSYPLSKVSSLKIPPVDSGRIYFSIAYPMSFNAEINDKGQVKIADPDGFSPTDPNYYFIYDKVEFTYNKNGFWINPTAVDYFSIPIRITTIDEKAKEVNSGFSYARSTVLKQIQDILLAEDQTNNQVWQNLYVKDPSTQTIIRFVAAQKAMVDVVDPHFDKKYLDDANTYGFNYIDFIWNYYKSHQLKVDTSELKCTKDCIYTGQVNQNNEFVFTKADKSDTVVIQKPTNSLPFFAGANGTFESQNNTPKAIIVRQLTSAFDVGLLPTDDQNNLINKAFFDAKRKSNQYYQVNSLLPVDGKKQGPWYDLYSKALHSFGDSQPIYTFAYDDALGQDGTLHNPTAQNISITLGSMADTQIPNPYKDDNKYTINFTVGANMPVIYNGKVYQSGAYSLKDVTMPFHVTVGDKEADIYLKYKISKPKITGLVIMKKSDSEYDINFPGK